MRPVFADDAVITRTCPSFGAPELIPVRGTVTGVSSSTVILAIGSRVGGSFTGEIVRVKLDKAVAPSVSMTISEIVQLPN